MPLGARFNGLHTEMHTRGIFTAQPKQGRNNYPCGRRKSSRHQELWSAPLRAMRASTRRERREACRHLATLLNSYPAKLCRPYGSRRSDGNSTERRPLWDNNSAAVIELYAGKLPSVASAFLSRHPSAVARSPLSFSLASPPVVRFHPP